MNLILIRDDECTADGRAAFTGARARHLREVMNVAVGKAVKVGRPGDRVGTGDVVSIENDGTVVIDYRLDRSPPRKAGIDLLLALPRPKVLARILEHATSLGVGKIAITRSWRVDKSYFESPILEPETIAAHLHAGLEQSGDTVFPTVEVFDRFKPFVEDRLRDWMGDARGYVLHPDGAARELDRGTDPAAKVVVAIGPEGGWIDYEVLALESVGFERRALGARILRVETAVAFAFGRLI